MCGIGGIVTRMPDAFPHAALSNMEKALRHRGPDDFGSLLWDGAGEPRRGRGSETNGRAVLGLVHRRLSIIDLTEGGWQPMSSSDGRYDIVFNGEIYNYIELRDELAAAGVRFRSSSDTEVLLEAWSRWGERALDRLIGMFAFALVDWKERRMLLVRDCFGIKPLYYTTSDGLIAFASEIKALLPFVSREVEPSALYRYLAYGLIDCSADTLYRDVRQVPPAGLVEVELDAARVAGERIFWRLPQDEDNHIGFDEAALKLRDLLADSVRLHLRSDVPVGACLSGGIDSSAIVALMREIGGDDVDLHAFTYVADATELNEEKWAVRAGETAKATMHKVHLEAGELARDFDTLIASQDLPFASTSIYAQYRVFEAAHAHGIKVMLDGQGADEMFAGYPFYISSRVASLVRKGRIGAAAWLLVRASSSGSAKLRDSARSVLALLPPKWSARAVRVRRALQGGGAINHAWFSERGAHDDRSFFEHRGTLKASLASTFGETNLPSLLRYEDRNSMVHSIESRVPFLTRPLAEFAFSLPERFLVAGDGSGKSVLRAALRGIVHDEILDRRDKIGFQTPEPAWFGQLGAWVSSMLDGDAVRAIPALNGEALRGQWQRMQQGRDGFHPVIWRSVNLVRWAELTGARFH